MTMAHHLALAMAAMKDLAKVVLLAVTKDLTRVNQLDLVMAVLKDLTRAHHSAAMTVLRSEAMTVLHSVSYSAQTTGATKALHWAQLKGWPRALPWALNSECL
jgi:hypothetical protein